MQRALVLIIVSWVAGCGGTAAGKIMADTPALPYLPPDISEITGIEEPDDMDGQDNAKAQPPAPAPAAQPKK
jgi:hypothetical protein